MDFLTTLLVGMILLIASIFYGAPRQVRIGLYLAAAIASVTSYLGEYVKNTNRARAIDRYRSEK